MINMFQKIGSFAPRGVILSPSETSRKRRGTYGARGPRWQTPYGALVATSSTG